MTEMLNQQVATSAAQQELADQRTAAALTEHLRGRLVRPAALPAVPVGPFPVADPPRAVVVHQGVAGDRSGQGFVAYALHVGGLLARHDIGYVHAMSRADLVYADGVSVVGLGHAAGAQRMERAATTDIGEDLLTALTADAPVRPRLALVGGPPGLAERAGLALAQRYAVEVVHVSHGFHQDWAPTLAELESAAPDVVIVGLGAPREMHWVDEHRDHFAHAVVLTCGGWFGFLAGDEHRAPALVRRLHGEWAWRWLQQPRRLARRYVLGAAVCAQLRLRLLLTRKRRRP